MVETQDILKLNIGTKETSALKPATVKIASVNIKKNKNDGEAMKTPLLEIRCKHPDKEDLIDFTKIKLERNGQLMVVATWINIEEEEGNKVIPKGSAIAHLMEFLKVTNIEDLYGKDIEAVEQAKDNHYLCLKAY